MNLLNKKGYTKVEVLVMVVLLGIVAFIVINKTSYAFEMDQTRNTNEVKRLIEEEAKGYAEKNLSLFKETDTTFINVNYLIEAGVMHGNEEGLVIDPADITKNFNQSKIKLEYNKEKNEVKATFVD